MQGSREGVRVEVDVGVNTVAFERQGVEVREDVMGKVKGPQTAVSRPASVCLPALPLRFTTSRQAVDKIVQIYNPQGVCDPSYSITSTHLVAVAL